MNIRNRLNDEQKVNILSLRERMSWGKMSEVLNLPMSTIRSFHRKWTRTHRFANLKQTGRPKSIDERLLNRICTFLNSTPRATRRMMRERFGLTCSERTLSKYLHRRNFRNYRMKVKPKLTAVHRNSRREFRNLYGRWPVEEWRKVLFSDECSVELFKVYPERIWRRPGTGYRKDFYLPSKTVFVKRYLKIWSCFGYYGTGPLVFVEGSMNGVKYCQILQDHLLTSGSRLCVGPFVFQDDNHSIHTGKLARAWRRRNRICRLEWPNNSSDLK
jgi:hypothetical protein